MTDAKTKNSGNDKIPNRHPLSSSPNMPQDLERIAQIGDNLLDIMAKRLGQRAGENQSTFSLSDLTEEIQFLKKEVNIGKGSAPQRNWLRLMPDLISLENSERRTDVLSRLLIARFEQLLPSKNTPLRQGKSISRSIIPGFIIALQHLIGKENLAHYQQKCYNLYQQVKAEHGEAFTWIHLYEKPDSVNIVDELLIYIAQYFQDMARSRIWMQGICVQHMSIPKNEDEKEWVFDDFSFHILIWALFSDVLKRCNESRDTMIARYGKRDIFVLTQMEYQMKRDLKTIRKMAKRFPKLKSSANPLAMA